MKTTEGLARVVGAVAAAMMAAGSALGDYQVGDTWNRFRDWVPGIMQDSTENNPSPDWDGNPVWSYEWTTGDGLASESPWFEQPTTMMVWDEFWFETGFSLWSRGDETSPLVQPRRLVHNVLADPFPYQPLVRWINPVGDGATVDIDGTLTVLWDGLGGYGKPNDIDVVIALEPSGRSITTLFADTLAKPTDEISYLESVDIPIHLPGIVFNEGDSLIISLRSHDSYSPYGAWNALYDDLTITLVPAPGAAGVLIAGGLVLTQRRRAA